MRFKGSNGKVCKMMTWHFRALLVDWIEKSYLKALRLLWNNRLHFPTNLCEARAQLSHILNIFFRFVAIVYPLRPQLQTKDAKKVIFVIWVFALALVSPYIAVLQLDNNGQCSETFKEKGLHAWAYTIAILLLQYIIPLSVIGLCYIRSEDFNFIRKFTLC